MPSTTKWTGREIPAVQVTTVTLSAKGIQLLLIDHELNNNDKSLERLLTKRAAILRDLRDCDARIKEHQDRQVRLQQAAVAVQNAPFEWAL